MQFTHDDDDSFDEVEEELMALESIYDIDSGEIIIERNKNKKTIVNLLITPFTGGANSKILVKGTLKLTLSNQYPEESIPEMSLIKVKGLSDEEEKECLTRLKKLANEYIGEPCLPLLCDACQEIFTEFNHAVCSICLEKLSDDHVGTRTNCFHAFHQTCLSEYYLRSRSIKAKEKIENSSSGETLDIDIIKKNLVQLRVDINKQLEKKKNIIKDLKTLEWSSGDLSNQLATMTCLKRKLTKIETTAKNELELKCKMIVVNIDEKKIEKKNVKQLLDKLLWKEKELKLKKDKVDKANKAMVKAEFNDNFNPPCPVCRSEISYVGFIEYILTPDGHPSYRRSGKIISKYGELKGEDSKVSSLKDKKVIKYVKNVQIEHEKLKKKLKRQKDVVSK